MACNGARQYAQVWVSPSGKLNRRCAAWYLLCKACRLLPLNSAEGVPLPEYAQIRGAVGHQLRGIDRWLAVGPRRIGRRAPDQ